MPPPLYLSSPAQLAEWLGGVEIDGALIESLRAAREVISAAVRDFDEDELPQSLHRAATMMAAAMHERSSSTYGVEAFSVGSADGVGFLTSDPTIAKLIDPWRRPMLGVADRVGAPPSRIIV